MKKYQKLYNVIKEAGEKRAKVVFEKTTPFSINNTEKYIRNEYRSALAILRQTDMRTEESFIERYQGLISHYDEVIRKKDREDKHYGFQI